MSSTLLDAAGRATLTVQTEEPPYKYVSVEGPVVIESRRRDDVVRLGDTELEPRFLHARERWTVRVHGCVQ